MIIAIVVVLLLVGALLLWFSIPYSLLKRAFRKDVEALKSEIQRPPGTEVFTVEDFNNLPIPVRNYLERCGYLGTPKMSYLKMEYRDVSFTQARGRPPLKIDYTQHNFVDNPARVALIDSSLFGIPFEGYDYYRQGVGGMKGVIAKVITLFDQTGPEMNRAALATFLAESLFAPTVALQDYLTFKEISDLQVQATINYGGIQASGVFTFNDQYEMVSFTTGDRAMAGTDGSLEHVPWSALCGNYQLSDSGIWYPKTFQAVWNHPDGDFTYFDGTISAVSYG